MNPRPDPRKVEELFHAVVDLPPDERRLYLDKHCPDPEVRQVVERLLAADSAVQRRPPVDPVFPKVPTTRPDAEGIQEDANVTDFPMLPGYEILAKLGQGGMGVVYKARQVALKRIVAVKMIRPEVEASAERSRRFRIEAEVVGRIQHPNIVQIYDVGEHQGRPFLVLEFIDGESLADRLDGKPWPARDAAQLLEDLARAIHEAHQHGIVHRDLKPSNVLLPKSMLLPKVTDFGIAKLLDTEARQTQTGHILGTPCYMAPEQAAGQNKLVGPATDVYGLGATLYELLTGQPPFQGESYAAVLDQVRHSKPVPPRRLHRGVPRDLETVCLKCLSKEPGDRYASADALAGDLRRFRNGEPIRARPVSRLIRLRLWCRRNPALAIATGLSAAALLVIAVLSVSFGVEQRRIAADLKVALTKAEREAALSTWDRGRQLCEEGEVGHGLLLMAQALERTPRGPEDANLRDALRIELAGWHSLCHALCQVWEHPDKVLAVAVSPDGKTAVTGCADGKVRLWHLNSLDPKGHCRHELAGHQGDVCAVAFSRQGHTFITGGADGKVYLWNAAMAQKIGPLEGEHPGGVCAVALSLDGKLALTGGADKKARLWDLSERTCRAILEHSGSVLTVAFSPDGNTFVTGGEKETKKGEARLYQTAVAHLDQPVFLQLKPHKEYPKRILSAAFCPEGKTLLLGDDNWQVLFWDVESRAQFALADWANGSIRGLAFASDGKLALVGAQDSATAHLLDVAALRNHWDSLKHWGVPILVRQGRKQPYSPLPHPGAVAAVAFAPDGQQFLTACEDGHVRVWRKAPGPSITALPHNPYEAGREYRHREFVVRAVAVHPSGQLVATAGWDGKVNLWKAPSGTRDGRPLIHPSLPDGRPGRVMTVAFTPDGQSILTGAKDGRVRIFDLKKRQVIHEIPHHTDGVSGLSISDDGELMFAGGDGVAQRWNLMTRSKIASALRHCEIDASVATAISPNKQRLLTAAEDGWAKLWDKDGELINKLQHQDKQAVFGGSFSHDGTRLVTASNDRTARVWDTATGNLQTTLVHRGSVFSAAFTPDGSRVLTGGRDGAQMWDIHSRRRVGPRYQHEAEVMHVVFSPDGKIAVLADWDGYGLLWALPQPVQGDPERISLWLQTAVGMKLDEGSGRQVLDGQSWLELQNRLRKLGETPRSNLGGVRPITDPGK